MSAKVPLGQDAAITHVVPVRNDSQVPDVLQALHNVALEQAEQ